MRACFLRSCAQSKQDGLSLAGDDVLKVIVRKTHRESSLTIRERERSLEVIRMYP